MAKNPTLLIIIGFLLSSLIISKLSFAVEYLRDERPAPGSVEDLESPIGESFKITPRKIILFPRLSDYIRDYIKGLPTFFSDTQLDFPGLRQSREQVFRLLDIQLQMIVSI